jgi:hypothetical protein
VAIHTDLPIYRTGVQLLSLAVKAQEQMPRGVKRSLGDKIDPLHPEGSPGSYARGQYNGIIAALQTLRENSDRAIRTTKATT